MQSTPAHVMLGGVPAPGICLRPVVREAKDCDRSSQSKEGSRPSRASNGGIDTDIYSENLWARFKVWKAVIPRYEMLVTCSMTVICSIATADQIRT